METTFTISEDGQITNPKNVGAFFRQHGEGTYTLISKPANVRSLLQNSYYWAVMVPMVKEGLREMGFEDIRSNDQVHAYLKRKFLMEYVHNTNNQEEVIELEKSTTELTTVQFSDFIAAVQQWSAEWLGCIIPDPGQKMEIDYPDK